MRLEELDSFRVLHGRRPWPWIAFDASGMRFAFAESESSIGTRTLKAGSIEVGASFALPSDLAIEGFSVDRTGTLLAAFSADELVTISAGEPLRSKASELLEPGTRFRAAAFDRTGERIWISAEAEKESVLIQVHATSHAVIAALRSAPFAAPSVHELYTHPQDDAVLLLAACGQEGTFARVAG